MPSPHRRLQAADVETFVREHCFAPAHAGLVGIELERHVLCGDGRSPVDHGAVRQVTAALGVLPGESRITYEPGGQLELSSPPRPGPSGACAVLAEDLAAVDPVVEDLGVDLVATGLHPQGCHELVVNGPRYAAMAAYLDQDGPCGRTMMCSTAALQVNVDVGGEAAQPGRWRLAHQLGPVLVAAFANSPVLDGAAQGWRCGRALTWAGIDPSRTLPADHTTSDPATAWVRYALDARVMLIRVSDYRYEPVLSCLPFAQWLDQGHELGFPTSDDLEYHLGTLFPPVRARGWLEMRMIDALPHPWWTVAAAVCAALLDDPEAAEQAAVATGGTGELWDEAARHGLEQPDLAAAARACFAAALEALPRLAVDPATVTAVASYNERFVRRGRCPADDVFEHRRPALLDDCALEGSWS